MQIIKSIQQNIHDVRGEKVMLDYDLAVLYEVETRVMNQAVKRNVDKFPEDFMFRLTSKEWDFIQLQNSNTVNKDSPSSQIVMMKDKGKTNSSQIVMSSSKNRGKAYLPYAFTEHGVTMLASVLRSKKAIEMNIAIIRAFTAIRRLVKHNNILFEQIQELRTEIQARLGEHDTQLAAIYDALENMLDEKQDEIEAKEKWENRERIGFKTGKK
jgi:phage regulator Rha-like protein